MFGEQVGSALFYAISSLLIMFANKLVFSMYQFPSFIFLALGQATATTLFLFGMKTFGYIDFPLTTTNFMQNVKSVFPLPIFFMLNMVSGLGGTSKLNIPMFTVLRRFSIPMTMLLEYLVLKKVSSNMVKVSVGFMILGAVIAAGFDLSFDVSGYIYILFNDLLTAANGVTLKKKLSDTKGMGEFGLLFYNSICSLPFILALLFLKNGGEDLALIFEYQGWTSSGFLFMFTVSSIMGFLLNYSIYLCTKVNSALTTTVIGCLKNVLSTYLGMVIGGDYKFDFLNFVGVNVSIFGSLLYSYVKYKEQQQAKLNKEQIGQQKI